VTAKQFDPNGKLSSVNQNRPWCAEPAISGLAGQKQTGVGRLKQDDVADVHMHIIGGFILLVRGDFRSCGRLQKFFFRPTDQPVALIQCKAICHLRMGAFYRSNPASSLRIWIIVYAALIGFEPANDCPFAFFSK